MNLNRRLLQQAISQRGLLLLAVGLSLAAGLLIVWQASLLTRAVQGVFLDGAALEDLSRILAALLGVMLLRGVVSWAGEISASALSRRVRASLREKLFKHLVQSGPAFTAGEQTGELSGVLLEGIESLDAYFSQYLPGLVAALLVPLTIWCFVLPSDVLTAVIFFVTAPLIPLFMLLIGSTAQSLTRRQWQTLSRLKAYFLDVLQGLTTLKALGRSQSQVQQIQLAGDRYRIVTMGVLRVAFTSALALELVATLSTAVIAVQVGLRLLYGGLSFSQAFFILLLAPEFYQPLRVLGSRFHSGMAGAAAAQRIFALLEQPLKIPVDPLPENQDKQPISHALSSSMGDGDSFQEIRLENVHFDYAEGRPALHGVSLSLQRGEIVALVGPSGAGKSTIAGLLLRFINPDRGEITVDGRPLKGIPLQAWRSQLAWVPQKPYFFPGTVLANLQLSNPSASLEQVIQAARSAHAHEFIQALPDGYDTLLAEGGSTLSAGQAQRLSVARAFVRDAPLLILDEATASLDAEHEALLQDSLTALLRDRSALIIAHRLNTIASAGRIVVLDSGQVVQSGDHVALLRQGGLYHTLVAAAVGPQEDVGEHSSLRSAQAFLPHSLPLVSDPPAASLGTYPSDSNSRPSSRRLFKWLLGWVAPFTPNVSLAALAGFATIFSSMALMGASAFIISAAALHPSIAELQVAIVSVRLFGISRAVFRYLERLLSHQATLRLLSSLRVRIYQSLEPLAPARLLGYRSGDLLARLVGDIESLEGFYVRGLAPPLVAVLVGLAAFALLAAYSLQLAAVLLLGLCLAGLGLPFLAHFMSKKASASAVAHRSMLEAALVDCLQGLPELALFAQVETRTAEVFRLNHALNRSQRQMSFTHALQTSMSGFLANLSLWALLVASIPMVSGGQLPGVYLAALLLIALASFEALVPLPQTAQHLRGDLASAGRLYELVDASPEVVDPPAPSPAPAYPDLQLAGLSFRYPAPLSSTSGQLVVNTPENPWILRDLSFSLPPGKRLALVGPSGGGKSTLLSLLLRFWEFEAGRITLYGLDLHDYSQQIVRSQFAVQLQKPYLFSASLLDNLRLGNPQAAQEQIESAVNAASLADFIQGLPQGYQTWVGEQGVRLSAGERQRVAIARLFLSTAPILALDEPTAHLDAITERIIMDSLLERSRGCSLLLVTHRLVRMEAMDEILVLSAGSVVERGTHSDLLDSGGLYRRMWDLQRRQLLG